MRERDTVIVVVLGLLLFFRRPKKKAESSSASQVESWTSATPERPIEMDMQVEAGDGVWVWPVPSLVDKTGRVWSAVVSSGFGGDRGDHKHAGQDIMYKRDGNMPPRTAGDHGSKGYWAPPGTPILAARAGRVWSTRYTGKGWMVVIDHGAPWSTMYLHLDSVSLPLHTGGKQDNGAAPVSVEAGDQIGVMGFSPVDGSQIRHLHFEVRKGGATSSSSIDPDKLEQRSWGRKTWRG